MPLHGSPLKGQDISRNPTTRTGRARATALLLVVWFAIAELVSYGCLYVLRGRLDGEILTRAEIYRIQSDRIGALLARPGASQLDIDPVLGWRYRSGYRTATDTMNDQGLRAQRQYSGTPGAGITRVAAFGDSFVYANEVADDDAWSALLEERNPQIEVLNYGVGGYGVDQAYLRYRMEGQALEPHTVLMGFVADDLRRVVNVYRRFISTSELPLFKPRYLLASDGDLTLLPTPVQSRAEYEKYFRRPDAVREAGVHDQWYEPLIYDNPLYDWSAVVRLGTSAWIRAKRRYFDPDRLVHDGQFRESSAAFRIQRRLFRLFATDVANAGAKPIVVFFPDKHTVVTGLAGQMPVYASLLRATRQDGVMACDLSEPFRRAAGREGVEVLFMSGLHYSRRGNELVAENLAGVLRSLQSAEGAQPELPDYCRATRDPSGRSG
jgi:hypothetical protein